MIVEENNLHHLNFWDIFSCFFSILTLYCLVLFTHRLCLSNSPCIFSIRYVFTFSVRKRQVFNVWGAKFIELASECALKARVNDTLMIEYFLTLFLNISYDVFLEFRNNTLLDQRAYSDLIMALLFLKIQITWNKLSGDKYLIQIILQNQNQDFIKDIK